MAAKNREPDASSDEAIRLQRQHGRLRELLAELELEYGPIPPEIEAEVEAAWRR